MFQHVTIALQVPFDPAQLCLSPRGRMYHPAAGTQLGGLGLVHTHLASELCNNLVVEEDGTFVITLDGAQYCLQQRTSARTGEVLQKSHACRSNRFGARVCVVACLQWTSNLETNYCKRTVSRSRDNVGARAAMTGCDYNSKIDDVLTWPVCTMGDVLLGGRLCRHPGVVARPRPPRTTRPAPGGGDALPRDHVLPLPWYGMLAALRLRTLPLEDTAL